MACRHHLAWFFLVSYLASSVVGKELNITSQPKCGDPRNMTSLIVPPDTDNCIFRSETVTASEPHDYFFEVPSVVEYDFIFTIVSLGKGKASMVVIDSNGREVNSDADPNGQSYLFLSREAVVREGNYTLRVQAANGEKALYTLRVFTPTKYTLLNENQRLSLEAFVKRCCPADKTSATCESLKGAVQVKRANRDDICHQPPNMCDQQGNLVRLQLAERQGPALTCDGGRLPWDIMAGFTSLRQLVLSNNNLTATGKQLGEMMAVMTNLTLFRASNNQFSGPLDCDMAKAPMRTLTLNSNNFTESLPTCFVSSFFLRSLSLKGNNLTGVLPKPGSNSGLEILLLSNQQGKGFTGSIPKDFLQWLGELKAFHATGNSLEGMVPSLPGTLVDLRLSDNRLTGPIPATILNLDTLEILDLSNNQLTGVIPQGLLRLPSIAILDLSNNELTGRIVPDFRSNDTFSSSLTFLRLSGNKLSGPVPAGLATAQSLIQIDLSDNKFSGSLDGFGESLPKPPNSDVSSNITFLSLNNNQLTGTVPTALMYLKTFDPLVPSYLTSTGGVVFPYLGLNASGVNGEFPTWLLSTLKKPFFTLRPQVLLPDSLTCPTLQEIGEEDTPDIPAINAMKCTDNATGASITLVQALQVPQPTNVSAPSASSSASTPITAPVPRSKKSDDAPPTGTIIGVIIGVIAAFTLGAVVSYLVIYKGKRRRNKHTPLEPPHPTMPMQSLIMPTSMRSNLGDATV